MECCNRHLLNACTTPWQTRRFHCQIWRGRENRYVSLDMGLKPYISRHLVCLRFDVTLNLSFVLCVNQWIIKLWFPLLNSIWNMAGASCDEHKLHGKLENAGHSCKRICRCRPALQVLCSLFPRDEGSRRRRDLKEYL